MMLQKKESGKECCRFWGKLVFDITYLDADEPKSAQLHALHVCVLTCLLCLHV